MIFLKPNRTVTQLRHYNNVDSLLLGFGNLSRTEMPFMVVHDTEKESYYNLSCFEDITDDVISLNNSEFESLIKADEKLISLSKRFLRQTVEDKRLTNCYIADASKRYEVIYVGGLFLGKKVKRRVLPITMLNDLKSLQIVEMSMSTEDFNDN